LSVAGKPEVRLPETRYRPPAASAASTTSAAEAAQELQEGQREDVEADVVAQKRIGVAERHSFRHSSHVCHWLAAYNAISTDSSAAPASAIRDLAPARKRQLDAVARREHLPEVAHRVDGEPQVQNQPAERDRAKAMANSMAWLPAS
jgi:hypothetical protein